MRKIMLVISIVFVMAFAMNLFNATVYGRENNNYMNGNYNNNRNTRNNMMNDEYRSNRNNNNNNYEHCSNRNRGR